MRRPRNFFLQLQFVGECSVDGSRFFKPMARTKVFNFAAENMKQLKKKRSGKLMQQREFGMSLDEYYLLLPRLVNALDLCHVLSYPIREVPLSLAHSDGILLKTDKATLTKTLESRQETVITYLSLPQIW